MKILHFADVHIGVETHGRVDSRTGLNTRLLDIQRCLQLVVDTAIKRGVDAVLFAGDAYDHVNPPPIVQQLFAVQMWRLSEAAIPTILVVGNHDMPVSFGKASPLEIFSALRVPHINVAVKPSVLNLETKSGALQVCCLPYPHRSGFLTKEEYRTLSENEIVALIEEGCNVTLDDFQRQVNPNISSVLLAHIACVGANLGGSERRGILGGEPHLTPSKISSGPYRYAALGHVHRQQDQGSEEGPPIVYSGSIDRIDFSDEGQSKGFCLVDITKDAVEIEFVTTPARSFVTIEVDVRTESNATRALLNAFNTRDVKDAIVRVKADVTDQQREKIDLPVLHEALSSADRIASFVLQAERERPGPRSTVTEGMKVEDALRRYIVHHDQLKDLGNEIIDSARELESELNES